MAKITIVTGASRGIGRAVAKRLAADGFAAVVNYAGNAAKAQETVKEIEAAGGEAIAVQGDVANATDVKQLFEKTIKVFGQIDAMMGCALPCRGAISYKTEAVSRFICKSIST